ncbi:hypothetical protein CAF53_01515 [Sphingobium sp. LB126]|uniref:hypothetical protein n=1 Tax=Sphingobium sp. LB126 TaxID=1983755 RepID=UPI000C2087F6|nr:hypothetical protein [Sphingobium sp. LB126]PJG47055.1 hypothetical protein CAF53_01515 [Sphingobium sp. LB126]
MVLLGIVDRTVDHDCILNFQIRRSEVATAPRRLEHRACTAMRRRRRTNAGVPADESQSWIEGMPDEPPDMAEPETLPAVASLPHGRPPEDRKSGEENAIGAFTACAEQMSTPMHSLSPTPPKPQTGKGGVTGIYDEEAPHVARRDQFSNQLIESAQGVFRDRLKREVSEAEARLLLGNLTDFYGLAIVRHRRLKRAAQDRSSEGEDP